MNASTEDYQSQSFHGGGLSICGMSPRVRIARFQNFECGHCKRNRRHVRVFSGSGWYEDFIHCLTCGEDRMTGYHPFARGWRKKAIASAKDSVKWVIPAAEYRRITAEAIRSEMGWSEE